MRFPYWVRGVNMAYAYKERNDAMIIPLYLANIKFIFGIMKLLK